MRKKKGVIITVTTALVIAACGVGCLHAGMEKTMQEEVVTQVESNPDVILEEGSPEEVENLVYQVNQVWQERLFVQNRKVFVKKLIFMNFFNIIIDFCG